MKLFVPPEKQNTLHMYRHEDWSTFDEDDEIYAECDIGSMDQICPHCNALLFPNEISDDQNRKYQWCCKRGTIWLPPRKVPNFLHKWLVGNDLISKCFRENIFILNSALRLSTSQMTRRLLPPGGPPKYILEGQVIHCTPNFNKKNRESHDYNEIEIYTIRNDKQAEKRLEKLSFLNRIKKTPILKSILMKLQRFLMQENWLVQQYITVYQDFVNNPLLPTFSIKIHSNIRPGTSTQEHHKNFAASTSAKIATIVHEHEESFKKLNHHAIIITSKEKVNRKLDERNSLCDPLVFPLFHPYADAGYSPSLKTSEKKKMRITEYYRYMLQQRYREFNPILHGGMLFEQYVSNTWARCRQIAMNQLKCIQKVNFLLLLYTYIYFIYDVCSKSNYEEILML